MHDKFEEGGSFCSLPPPPSMSSSEKVKVNITVLLESLFKSLFLLTRDSNTIFFSVNISKFLRRLWWWLVGAPPPKLDFDPLVHFSLVKKIRIDPYMEKKFLGGEPAFHFTCFSKTGTPPTKVKVITWSWLPLEGVGLFVWTIRFHFSYLSSPFFAISFLTNEKWTRASKSNFGGGAPTNHHQVPSRLRLRLLLMF